MRNRAPRGTDTEFGYAPLITFPHRLVQRVRAFLKIYHIQRYFGLRKWLVLRQKVGWKNYELKIFTISRISHQYFGSSATWYKMVRA
jgi:hypothetical protein